ncbi:MAG: sulfur carrier protein ThiS [Bacteroidia bacterium]|jgi:sulfur carrier protein|nr:sulfur carrier protein ThiS [Bacteroidia bacterium]
MTIFINDVATEIPNTTHTLTDVLKNILNISKDKKGIAIAVNEEVIPKNQWDQFTIKENDRLLVIIAAQGG